MTARTKDMMAKTVGVTAKKAGSVIRQVFPLPRMTTSI